MIPGRGEVQEVKLTEQCVLMIVLSSSLICHVKVLFRQISDHITLILKLETHHNWGPKPFRSVDAWFSKPNLKKLLSEEWNKLQQGLVHHKLSKLKLPIKV